MHQATLRTAPLIPLVSRNNREKKFCASVLTLGALSACGGGGDTTDSRGSDAGGDTVANTSVFGSTPIGQSVSLSYYLDGSVRDVVRAFYPVNLDSSAGQELIVAGAPNSNNLTTGYSSTSFFIVDLENGGISNITSSLLPNNASAIESVGDVVWGDFNNDGKIDFFTAANADMDFSVNAYFFIGANDGFERHLLEHTSWQHGASALDINGDGYDDIYAVGYSGAALYFGSETGLVKYEVTGNYTNEYYSNGSGVALGDFLNNGHIQAIIVDSSVVGMDVADTILFEISVDDVSQIVTLTDVAILPEPLLESSMFDDVLTMIGERSHDVRAEPIDFNNDGLLDVIVFSRSSYDPVEHTWPRVSQVQFLKNEGGGVFSDVTSAVLPNYDYNSNVGYEPVFDDFNKDGYLDIFMSDADFGSSNRSSVFFLGSSDGSFEEFGRDELTALVPENGGMATVVKDANEDFWLLVGSQSVGVDGTQENLTLYSIDFA